MSDKKEVQGTDTKPDIKDAKELTGIYKKNGLFDNQRKLLLANFKESQTHSNLLLKLKLMVENKIKNDPTILLKNKAKMAALIQGEIMIKSENSLLSIVDKDIQDKIIDSPDFHNKLKFELRDVKRKHEGVTDGEFAAILKEEEAKSSEDRRMKVNKVTKAPRFVFNPKSSNARPPIKESKEKKDFHLMY